jgi:hypothetical protein
MLLPRALCFLFAACLGHAAEEKTAEANPIDAATPPDRRELWVPMNKLGDVLTDEKAVLLTREQYNTLLRDAGLEKPKPVPPPRDAAITTANYSAKLDGKTVVITGDLRVTVLADGWVALPLDFPGAALGEVKLDRDTALAPRELPAPPKKGAAAGPEKPNVLMLRGKGPHTLNFTLTAPVHAAAGQSTVALVLPPTAAGAFVLSLPAGAKVKSAALPVKAAAAEGETRATVALTPLLNTVALTWRAADTAPAAQLPVAATAVLRYALDAERLDATFSFHLATTLGDLPNTFEFTVPAEAKVLGVEAAELSGWEAKDGKVTARLQPGARREIDLRLSVELPALANADKATLALPVPELSGAPRLEGAFTILADDSVVVRDVITDPATHRMPSTDDRGGKSFSARYRFESRPAVPRVTIERAQARLEASIDTLAEFRSDAIYIERTITLREEQGKRFTATINLPEGEELLTVRRVTEIPKPQAGNAAPQLVETEPEWRAEKNAVTITWADAAETPRVFKLRSRIEPAQWTQLPAAGVLFSLRDAVITDAGKVTGYIALAAEPTFRLEAAPGETLERSDREAAPITGDYVWARRATFDLGVRVFKRPAEVLAALTGYALPLEGVLDLHAAMNYQFLHGGTRAVRLRVPRELAANFHFDGPQIAERTLNGDVWTITFQKELTGAYALAITAQVPVPKLPGAGADTAHGYSFAVKVPVITPLDVARVSGLWAVEANTETEISFDAPGLNEFDTLLAPRLADYQPRHRVIGVFGWIGADYSLSLRGVRHTPAEVLSTVVDRLDLDTLASPGGLHRHQAALTLRTAGAQYLDLTLPAKATLLSLAVDGAPVKPVAATPGTVRIQLPAKREANAPISATLLYETPGEAWENRGYLSLNAPAFGREIPVLRSRWRLWLPDGFEYSGYESNLHVPEQPPDELLAAKPLKMVAGFFAPSFSARPDAASSPVAAETATSELARQYADAPQGFVAPPKAPAKPDMDPGRVANIMARLQKLIPAVNFREASLSDAMSFLTQQTGVSIRLSAEAQATTTKITLTLKNVPAIEVIKYVTNLASAKYRISGQGVEIVPLGTETSEVYIKEWKVPPEVIRSLGPQPGPNQTTASEFLTASGVTFPPGTFAMYSPASGTLVVKHTADQLALIEHLLKSKGVAAAIEPQAKAVDIRQNNQEELQFDYLNGPARKTAGLLPVLLELPRSGHVLVFEGLTAPQHVELRYDDWWSRARRLWMWFVAGGIVFYLAGRARPWWRTLWAVLLLSAIPLCFLPSWTGVCNALLGGWLAGLVLDRIAARLVFRVQKEVLA